MTTDDHLVEVEKALDRRRVVTLVTAEMAAGFSHVDRRSYAAGLSGSDPEGLYKPAGPAGATKSGPPPAARGCQ